MNYGIIIEGLEATNKKLAAENERLRGELIASQNARKAMCSGWHRFVEMASVHKNRKASEAGANLDREQDAAMGVTSAAPAPAPDSRQAAILEALDDDPTAFHAVAPAPAPSPAPASPSVRGALWRLLKAIDNDDGVTKDCGDELNCARQEGRSALASQTPQPCSMDVKKDASEIVRRLTERNPDFVELIKDGRMSLVNFAEIVIVQFLSFNGISLNTQPCSQSVRDAAEKVCKLRPPRDISTSANVCLTTAIDALELALNREMPGR